MDLNPPEADWKAPNSPTADTAFSAGDRATGFWVCLGIVAVTVAALLLGAGCASKQDQADPYTAATGAGAAKTRIALDAARWSNDQVVERTTGATQAHAKSTAHSIDQAQDGVGEILAANQKTAQHVADAEKQRDKANARADAYDHGWLGGKAIAVLLWVKRGLWTIFFILLALEIGAQFLNNGPIGVACKGVLLLLRGFCGRLVAPVAVKLASFSGSPATPAA